jgi:hypothetical protein
MTHDDTPTPDGKPPSKLKLVSDNPTQQVSRNRDLDFTKYELDRAVAALAANILRVLAGGGQRGDIANDLIKSYEALMKYLAAHKPHDCCLPDFADALPFLFTEDIPLGDDNDWDNGRCQQGKARQQLRRAALRGAAARLLGQGVQVTRTDSDLDRALDNYESG